ncbi:importin beta-4 subunit [Aspergillus luchuensis]|uniref:Importin beta-4 subunit n=1 Tax=Aspergillus kawachii TaxID=1069201 RepID=A0A146FJA1_ASPKA|nr:importin beta-4 subunit [Aspergillus luchuensis]
MFSMISRTFFQWEDPSITALMSQANQLSSLSAILPQEMEEEEPRKDYINEEGLCRVMLLSLD